MDSCGERMGTCLGSFVEVGCNLLFWTGSIIGWCCFVESVVDGLVAMPDAGSVHDVLFVGGGSILDRSDGAANFFGRAI